MNMQQYKEALLLFVMLPATYSLIGGQMSWSQVDEVDFNHGHHYNYTTSVFSDISNRTISFISEGHCCSMVQVLALTSVAFLVVFVCFVTIMWVIGPILLISSALLIAEAVQRMSFSIQRLISIFSPLESPRSSRYESIQSHPSPRSQSYGTISTPYELVFNEQS